MTPALAAKRRSALVKLIVPVASRRHGHSVRRARHHRRAVASGPRAQVLAVCAACVNEGRCCALEANHKSPAARLRTVRLG